MSERSESTNLQEQEQSVTQDDTLEEKKLRFEREKEKWNIWSNIITLFITVGIGTYGVTHINNVYQERQLKREQILKEKEIELLEKKAAVERQKAEMQYLGQFLKHALEDDAKRRLRFAEYFAKLTVSPDLQQRWKNYHAILLDNQEELDKKENVLFSSGGLFASNVNEQETEKLIQDIVNLRSKVESLPNPQKKIAEATIKRTIFKIRCSSSNPRTETTGFFLKGQKGIITALHAVVGCKDISAVGGADKTYYKDLKLIQADITHDIAILSFAELQRVQQVNSSGLPAAAPQPSYEGLYLIGYPLGLPHPISGNINIRIPPLTELWKLLPVSNVRILKKRNSPDISIKVLNLEGTALPGQSGAPLLNGENQVVGIINGGLKGGTVGVSWAIPLENIQFQPVAAIRKELVRLSNLPLFSEKSVPDPEAEKKNTEEEAHSSGALL